MELFGTSGIRRMIGKELIELAQTVGLVVGSIYHRVLIASDSRTSNDTLKFSIISGLLAAGSECYDAEIIPTPTLALATKGFDAGVMITASHNPPQYNGIKLLNPDGSAFDSKQRRQIENQIAENNYSVTTWDRMKQLNKYNSAINQHIDYIVDRITHPLKTKVVVDCGCGAGSMITPYLLKKMGCDVIEINCYPSGLFPRASEPIEENLQELINETRNHSADLGIAHDGDADRMMIIDDKGRFVSGDKLMVIFAQQISAKKITTVVDASMVIDEMGFDVMRTKVGDPYVSEELRKGGDFGGEPSGSWIFPSMSLCPDGIYAAALVAAIANKQKISLLIDKIPSYHLIRGSVEGEGIVKSDLDKQLNEMNPLSINNIDGTKLNFEDGWVLIRPSGTEPKIRITAEARTSDRANILYNHYMKIVQQCLV